MRSFLPSVALVTAAFLFGCQDMGPIGPEGPGILVNKAGPHPHGDDGGKALLFVSGFTCAAGATPTGQSFGHVSWGKVFVGDAANGDDHVHYKLKLTGVDQGTYEILGNQDRACDLGNVDF